MYVIHARNVNDAFAQGIDFFRRSMLNVSKEPSRNGAVLVACEPVTTVYYRPTERVLFCALRDANPFFHLFESIWMVAGRRDAAYPAQFAKQILEYADDGVLHGAYGHRWRSWFGVDQLRQIVAELSRDPSSRRCVLGMWDPSVDLTVAMKGGKDVPCNTQAFFRVQEGTLDMTVTNRSNDVIWGAYGANAVHFSVLQELVATGAGLTVGRYYQVSNNYHVYADRPDVQRLLAAPMRDIEDGIEMYDDGELDGAVEPLLMFTGDLNTDISQAEEFVGLGSKMGAQTAFYAHVALPMLAAHTLHKKGDTSASLEVIGRALRAVPRNDWLVAATQWLQRRMAKKENV